MERLTKRITQYTIELSASANPTQYNGSSQRVHIKHPFWNVFDRLCKYEDAEENGLLIKLPCRVGDTVWKIDWLIDRDRKLCKECVYYCNDYYGSCDYDGDGVPDCTKAYETVFTLDMFDEIGKTVFLTEAEAEQALKQMGE